MDYLDPHERHWPVDRIRHRCDRIDVRGVLRQLPDELRSVSGVPAGECLGGVRRVMLQSRAVAYVGLAAGIIGCLGLIAIFGGFDACLQPIGACGRDQVYWDRCSQHVVVQRPGDAVPKASPRVAL